MSCPIHVVEFFDLRLIQGRGTSVKNRSMVITDLQYEPEITHIVPLYDDFDITRTRFFFALVLARFHLRSSLQRCVGALHCALIGARSAFLCSNWDPLQVRGRGRARRGRRPGAD